MKIFGNQSYPTTRMRRNRSSEAIRRLFSSNFINPQNLIYPIFICEGSAVKEPISKLPDVFRYSIDETILQIKQALSLGISSFMLFPKTLKNLKNEKGSEALNPDNLVCRAVKEIKNRFPQCLIITDVALDPYTSHGHDGLIDEKNDVINDETNEILCQQALIQAQAGCDIVAPSDMMDGRIGQIRQTLDYSGFAQVGIFSYSAKYASKLYSPFRDAVDSSSNLQNSDKKSYQMDFCRNSNEALLEAALDLKEGADALIIKPASFYLDVIKDVSQAFASPIIAYQVSGEYAMLKYLANQGSTNSFFQSKPDFTTLCYENLIGIKRAGASAIISYAALQIFELS
jgi:porphobilinogen synthase